MKQNISNRDNVTVKINPGELIMKAKTIQGGLNNRIYPN